VASWKTLFPSAASATHETVAANQTISLTCKKQIFVTINIFILPLNNKVQLTKTASAIVDMLSSMIAYWHYYKKPVQLLNLRV